MPDATPNDPRTTEQISGDRQLADEFANKGTLKHYLLRRGFMPHDEKDAEAILDGIIDENERLTRDRDRSRGYRPSRSLRELIARWVALLRR